MNILCIGNSFAVDACRYLHRIARAEGEDISTTVLYIGGCSLERHYRNMLSGKPAYELVYNGESTGFPVSMEDALLNRNWDVVTLQQVSWGAVDFASFQPYLQELSAFVKECAPHAKQVIHQTWSYLDGGDKLAKYGYNSHDEMEEKVIAAYKEAAKAIDAAGIIPSGELFQKLNAAKTDGLYREDGKHAGYGAGRYALGLLWYGFFTEKNVSGNTFDDLDIPCPAEELQQIRQTVQNCLKDCHFA